MWEMTSTPSPFPRLLIVSIARCFCQDVKCSCQVKGGLGLPFTDSGAAGHVGAATAHLGRVTNDGATGGSGEAAPIPGEVEDSRCSSYSVQVWFRAIDTVVI